jgi:lactate dehydrogenase-like 2-hydroxyacid dehydrogenase
MDVVAWSPHRTDQRAGSAGIRRVDKDQLLSTADIVTIHMVLSDGTRGLISARELDTMKPTSLLVNTSRGPIVDQSAQLDALRSRRIAGAALEENYRVFYGEAADQRRMRLRPRKRPMSATSASIPAVTVSPSRDLPNQVTLIVSFFRSTRQVPTTRPSTTTVGMM